MAHGIITADNSVLYKSAQIDLKVRRTDLLTTVTYKN